MTPVYEFVGANLVFALTLPCAYRAMTSDPSPKVLFLRSRSIAPTVGLVLVVTEVCL